MSDERNSFWARVMRAEQGGVSATRPPYWWPVVEEISKAHEARYGLAPWRQLRANLSKKIRRHG